MENMTKEAWAAKIQSLYNQFIEQRANKPAAATAKSGEEKASVKCNDGKPAGLTLPDLASIAPDLVKILEGDGTEIDGLGLANGGGIALIASYKNLQDVVKNFQLFSDKECMQKSADKLFAALRNYQLTSSKINIAMFSEAIPQITAQVKALHGAISGLLTNSNASIAAQSNSIANPNIKIAPLCCVPKKVMTKTLKDAISAIESALSKERNTMLDKSSAFLIDLKAYNITGDITGDGTRNAEGLKDQIAALQNRSDAFFASEYNKTNDAFNLTFSKDYDALLTTLKNTGIIPILSETERKTLDNYFGYSIRQQIAANQQTYMSCGNTCLGETTRLKAALQAELARQLNINIKP